MLTSKLMLVKEKSDILALTNELNDCIARLSCTIYELHFIRDAERAALPMPLSMSSWVTRKVSFETLIQIYRTTIFCRKEQRLNIKFVPQNVPQNEK